MLRNVAFRLFLALLPIPYLFQQKVLLSFYLFSVFLILFVKKRRLILPFFLLSLLLILSFLAKNRYFSVLERERGAVVQGRGLVLSEKSYPFSKVLKVYVPVLKTRAGKTIAYSKIFTVKTPVSEKFEGYWIFFEGILKREKTYLNKFTSNLNYLKYSNSLYFVAVKDSLFLRKIKKLSVFSYKKRLLGKFKDSEKRDFLAALIFGDKDSLNLKLKTKAKRLGIYHLFVFSGFHFGVFYLVLYLLLFFVPLRKKYRNVLALAVLFIPLLITGFSAPALRVFAMFFVYIVFSLSGIEVSPEDAVGLAGITMLLFNPYYSFAVGFLLSFLISGGIVRYVRSHGFFTSYFSVSFVAFYFGLPFYAGVFNYIPVEAPFVNILLMPFILIVFFMFFANIFLGGLLTPLISFWLNIVFKGLNSLPVLSPECFPPYWVFIVVFVVIFASFFFVKRGRQLFMFTVLLMCLVIFTPAKRFEGVCFFDGKKPYCVLFSNKSFSALVNTGDNYFSYLYLYKELRMRGVEKLDCLIVEKLNTRILNGIENIVSRLPVKTLILPSGIPFYLKEQIENLSAMYSVKNTVFVPFEQEKTIGVLKLVCSEGGLNVSFENITVSFGNSPNCPSDCCIRVFKTKEGESIFIDCGGENNTFNIEKKGGICIKKGGIPPVFN